ncbi:MAG: amidohydrolase family protein, partial [Planctomycetaceae bacterium]
MRLALLAICCLAPISAQASTIIHAGRLIDGQRDDARVKVSIVIDEGKVQEVVDGFVSGKDGDTVIDLKAHTVMPGFMDMHTHLMSQHSKKSYTEKFFMNKSEYALRSSVYAKRTLLAGFTTVRNLGDDGVNSVSLRKAIDAGWIIGPRIFTAGKSLATTGGHADPTNGLRGDFVKDAGPIDGVVNGVDDAR